MPSANAPNGVFIEGAHRAGNYETSSDGSLHSSEPRSKKKKKKKPVSRKLEFSTEGTSGRSDTQSEGERKRDKRVKRARISEEESSYYEDYDDDDEFLTESQLGDYYVEENVELSCDELRKLKKGVDKLENTMRTAGIAVAVTLFLCVGGALISFCTWRHIEQTLDVTPLARSADSLHALHEHTYKQKFKHMGWGEWFKKTIFGDKTKIERESRETAYLSSLNPGFAIWLYLVYLFVFGLFLKQLVHSAIPRVRKARKAVYRGWVRQREKEAF